MDAILKSNAEELAREMATQARTVDDLKELMRGMMKAALERMLNTEMDVHLGCRNLSDGSVTPNAVSPSPASESDQPPFEKSPQRTFPKDPQRRYGRSLTEDALRSQRLVRAAVDRQTN